jgi:hypothetical protein
VSSRGGSEHAAIRCSPTSESLPIEIISGSDNKEQSAALRFLAIHEFGKGEQLGDTVGAFEPVSEWTRRTLREAVGIEAGIWRRVDQERI